MLAPLRFSRPDGANDITLDPVRSTSKFALRASMGQGDPGDPGVLVEFCTWNIKSTLIRNDYEGFRCF